MNIAQARITALVVATLVLVLLVPDLVAAGSGGSSGTVPNFKIKNLAGKNVELAALRENGPVLLTFWATWCKPCLRELSHMEKLHQDYGEQGLQVVAVSVDQTRSQSKVKSYVKTHGYGFEVLLDPNQRTLRRLKGDSVPYLVLVSAEGENLYTHSGYRDGDELRLRELVDAVMSDFTGGTESGGGEDVAREGEDETGGESETGGGESGAEETSE